MIIAITTNDNKKVGEFSSSKILLVDTETDRSWRGSCGI